MISYKSVLPKALHEERADLADLRRAWSNIFCESYKLDGPANEGVGVIGRYISEHIDAIDAELNLRRARGIGTAPLVLPDIHDAPTVRDAMAS